MKIFLSIAFIALSGFVITAQAKSHATEKSVAIKTVGIDVRSAGELKDNPAPGALHIPMSQLETSKLLPKDLNAPIHVFCEAGGRAGRAQKILTAKGYKNVTNIGDWRTWNEQKKK